MDCLLRPAVRADVPAIVRMLADDPLGKERERDEEPLPESYWRAFEAIDASPHDTLAVAERDGRVVGTLQLTFLPGLSYRGGWRAQVEGVRVDASVRGERIGQRLVEWAVERARAHGCRLVQLSTDKQRTDAKRFYERLGFVASHEGMKLRL